MFPTRYCLIFPLIRKLLFRTLFPHEPFRSATRISACQFSSAVTEAPLIHCLKLDRLKPLAASEVGALGELDEWTEMTSKIFGRGGTDIILNMDHGLGVFVSFDGRHDGSLLGS